MTQQMKAKVRVHFGQFVKGEPVDDLFFMKRVEDRRCDRRYHFDHDVWSISPRFDPQHRFFGMFCAPDWFVAFSMQSRKHLAEHPDNWHVQIDKCARVWSSIFHEIRPYRGVSFADYVTENGEHRDDRWYPI
jgi:hypothetical protein